MSDKVKFKIGDVVKWSKTTSGIEFVIIGYDEYNYRIERLHDRLQTTFSINYFDGNYLLVRERSKLQKAME